LLEEHSRHSSNAVFEAAEFLRDQDVYKVALQLYGHLLRQNLESAGVHYGLGECHGKIYAYERALRHLRRAFELEPDRTRGTNYFAYMLERNLLMDEAAGWYAKAVAGEYADDLWTLSHHAYFLEKYGRAHEAESAYQDVLRRNPGYTWAIKRYALFLLEQGQPERSEALMREALAKFGDRPFAQLNFLEYLILREREQECDAFRQALPYDRFDTPFQVVVDLLDYFRRHLLKGTSDPELRGAYERRARGLRDSVHRDFDDLNELLASRKGDVAEWGRLVDLMLK
jgi:tetratricopeptide (TPR) repeat protein